MNTRTPTGRSTCSSSSSPRTHRNLCVVGDPDQSIYKWRGADLRNILDFEHDFPEAAIVRLERNYRSTQVILDAASAVISQNRNRKEKRLYTDRTGGARILYYRAGDDIDEAEFIARTARDGAPRGLGQHRRHPVSHQRAVANGRRRAAPRRASPTRSSAASASTSARKSRTPSPTCKLVLNPHDDVSLRRVINVPARGIGKGVMESLDAVELAATTTLPPLLAGLQPVADQQLAVGQAGARARQRLLPRAPPRRSRRFATSSST